MPRCREEPGAGLRAACSSEPARSARARLAAATGPDPEPIEIAESGTFELRPTGRYAQSETYVRGLAELHGFAVKAFAHTVIRLENDRPVTGAIFVLINTRSPA